MKKNYSVVADNLVKTYEKNGVVAVDGISFNIENGQILGLLGPNGAGKTTLIKMILGLIEPTSGHALLCGYDIQQERSKAIINAGAILEGARNIYWRLSARQNLEYFGRLRGLSGQKLKTRIDSLLDLVQMTDRADEETRLFSRGMKQKVALAISLIHEPKVLLLDEPTLGLDVQASRIIEKIIKKQAADGKSVLLTTHQMDLAQRVSDTIVVIDKGKIATEGTTEQVLKYFGDQQQTIQVILEDIMQQERAADLFKSYPDVTFECTESETTLLWSSVGISQQNLLEFLGEINNMGLTLKQIGTREATLEEVFIRLTSGESDNVADY